MSRISVELVPRTRAGFDDEVKTLSENFPSVDTINIPDIDRYELSGLEAASLAGGVFDRCIPHLRACSFDRERGLSFEGADLARSVSEVLVVRGDCRPAEGVESPYDTIGLIKAVRSRFPEITVYAGFDQYRSDMDEELDYARRKLDAGAAGFFTQPFFDMDRLLRHMDALSFAEVFWGVSPVLSERSRDYWRDVNNVDFPEGFLCSPEWNRCFAREVLKEVRARGSSIYFMPIKADIVEYLSPIICEGV